METERASSPGAAFYARRGGALADWWTVLHPPYTAWHLAYVVIGAVIAPAVVWSTLIGALVAFFLAVGVAAHALDELNGHPLGTSLGSAALTAAASAGLAGAVAIGAAGVARAGLGLVPFVVLGALLVLAYNLEWLGGIVHNDLGFAAAWGAFPVLTAYYAEARTIGVAAVAAAGAAGALAAAQRQLSRSARTLRRRARSVDGSLVLQGGEVVHLTRETLLAPLEAALKAMSWGVVALAVALALARAV